ncbi:Putative NACHT nucleoside triphosphatase, P-loop containing nucleoside triphosphate hydrolase [Colletotrichum destructivum]|uniref:NACHT nucleoside triphosphatase, P-loop containing nucleoside triphosphate hydrolase n=1 Tax=Colletotrichum destructivum TaxID=34406 RepID=A0AAX4J1B4_9PEZI|nr:Putative NACHT nucleoside triphosphatase, P-loop containing nucleoside triphosphate hydrolase [Colletotrichum destructivum]
MEAVGIAASIAGLVLAVQECYKIVNKHVGSSKIQSEEIKQMHSTLRQFLTVVGGFRAVLEASQEDEDRFNRMGRLGDVMTVCRKILEEIIAYEDDDRLKKLIRGAKFDKRLKQSMTELHDAKVLLNLAISAEQDIIIAETNKFLHQVGETVENVFETVQATAEKMDDIRGRFQSQEDVEEKRKILDWISTRTFGPIQTDLLNRLQEGTGEWFLEAEPFQTWQTSACENDQILFGPGSLGSGKTMITAAVIEHLHQKHKDQAGIAISYVFCNYKNRELDDSITLLRCLLRQIVDVLPSVPESLKEMHKKEELLTLKKVSGLLQEAASKCSNCFIIVDALDEFQSSSHQNCMSLLSEITKARAHAKVFATSRPIPRICSFFEGRLSQEIRATHNDLDTVLESHIARCSRVLDRDVSLRDEVEATIIGAVNGMFLLAQLYLNRFDGILTVREVKNTLKSLREHSTEARLADEDDNDWQLDVLSHAYDDTMSRIRAKKGEHRDIALNAIKWITHARRPLQPSQLQEAMVIRPKDTEFDQEAVADIDDILSVCEGLVVVDGEADIVRLHHYAAQEYFERTREKHFPDGEFEISGTCATYLSLESIRCYKEACGICKDNGGTKPKDAIGTRLLWYVAPHWGYHVRRSSRVHAQVQSLLSSSELTDTLSDVMNIFVAQHICEKASPLHLAAYFGADTLLQSLIDGYGSVYEEDKSGETPLCYAIKGGWESTVRLLLENGATVCSSISYGLLNHPGYSSALPLRLAVGHGHIEIFQILAREMDEDLEIACWVRHELDGEMLSLACARGLREHAKLLLERGADPNWVAKYHQCYQAVYIGSSTVLGLELVWDEIPSDSKEGCRERPLANAIKASDLELIDILMEAEATVPEVEDESIDFGLLGSAQLLAHAAFHDAMQSVQFLLDKGVSINQGNWVGHSVLSASAKVGKVDNVKILLDLGADVESRDAQGRSPLSHAVGEYGCPDVVRLLLEHGADPESIDDEGRNPLSIAVEQGPDGMAEVLLDHGCRVNVADNGGRTPISYCWLDARRIKTLIKHGADLTVKDHIGRTLLMHAVLAADNEYFFNTEIVDLLLKDHQALLYEEDSFGRSPFAVAIAYHKQEVVEHLLLYAGNPFAGGEKFSKPVFLAAELGNEALCSQFLQRAIDLHHVIPGEIRESLDRTLTSQAGFHSFLRMWSKPCSICLSPVVFTETYHYSKLPFDTLLDLLKSEEDAASSG